MHPAAELQALADRIKANHAAKLPPSPARPLPGPLRPVIARGISAYKGCSLCGSQDCADHRCYSFDLTRALDQRRGSQQ